MTALVVTPNLEKSLVQRRGIVTVPQEDATVSCDCVRGQHCAGLVVNELPLEARTLERHMKMMGNRFIDRMKARELEWVGGDMRLHGPWPSYEFNRTLADVESGVWKAAERDGDASQLLPFVLEQPVGGAYSDYLLVADFMATNVWTELEVPDAYEGRTGN